MSDSRRSQIILSLLCWLMAVPSMSPAALSAGDVLEPKALTPETSENGTFEYVLEGRPDPFAPFITEKASTPQMDPNEIIDTDTKLTGMQLFEPAQLTLVAVMQSSKDRLAMVEDMTGKGYILKEGTLIGRRGIVTSINKQEVLITETAHTRSGKEIKNIIAMRMKTEGE